MVFPASYFLLIEDGTLKTYEYHANMVALKRWLEDNQPVDVHHLSQVNHQELREADSPMIEILSQPGELEYYQHVSQGTFHYNILT